MTVVKGEKVKMSKISKIIEQCLGTLKTIKEINTSEFIYLKKNLREF